MRIEKKLVAVASVLAATVAVGCATDGPAPVAAGADDASAASTGADNIEESPAARGRIDQLRSRFLLSAPLPRNPSAGYAQALQPASAPAVPRAALADEVASGFKLRNGFAHPVIAAQAKQGVSRTATVVLPALARDPVRIEDDTSHVAVAFALRGASDAAITTAGGIALYAGALRGADVVHRVSTEGTEDYVVFEQRPATEALAYDVDLLHVAGLRLVSNTIEFLDEGGTPRLRVAPPYLVDANGARTDATLALEGCDFDASTRAVWGRVVTPPGASRCAVRVSWAAAVYPAMVDPSWLATGSMSSVRYNFTATLLGSGDVLVAGGALFFGTGNASTATAELYNPSTRTFAATGSMAAGRYAHTATPLSSGAVLVAGGTMDGVSSLSDAEIYNPATGTFAATGALMTARFQHAATLLGSGKVLIAGGTINGGGGSALAGAELYDPAGGTFTSAGSMTTARYFPTATLLGNGSVLLAGGSTYTAGGANPGPGTLSSAEVYNPATGMFAAIGSMATPRCFHTATLLASGLVLVAGGNNAGNTTLASAELYNPATNAFTAAGSMTATRNLHTATLLGSGGEVLVAGGTGLVVGKTGVGSALSTTELYNPVTNAFTATGSMTTTRALPTATLLGSGAILVAGGDDTSNHLLSSAELADLADLADSGSGGSDSGGGGADSGIDAGNVADAEVSGDASPTLPTEASADGAVTSRESPGRSGCGCVTAGSRGETTRSGTLGGVLFALTAFEGRRRSRNRRRSQR